MTTSYNVQYNIPRVQVQLPGRQNRLSNSTFRVTPSMTEPVIFVFGNQDGVPLNLLPFSVRFVVWSHQIVGDDHVGLGQADVLINKRILVQDPYSGSLEMVLTEEETLTLGHHAAGRILKWSLFMINEEGEVFPTQVSNTGSRFGTVSVDMMSALPLAEIIKSPIG